MSADGNGRMANGISDEAKIRKLAQASITSEADMSAQVEAAIRNGDGKWVRYDENGIMLKGWVKIEGALAECYSDQAGNVYYYDQKTGLMAKGDVTINGVQYHFDEITGVLDSGEVTQQKYVCTSQKTYINGVLNSETIYDERGNELKTIRYRTDGSSYIQEEWQYDERGNEIYYKSYAGTWNDSDKYSEYYYEYDADGNKIKTTRIDFIGEIDYIFYVREVDENGNVTKEGSYTTPVNGDISYSEFYYEYDAEGNKD